jgi:DNA-binding transcriptional LysR family regulator
MNWDDAKYFLAVARSGQMLGAANRLGVSQAKLSRRIASLESSLDTKLLTRSPSGCKLTSNGHSFLAKAERIETEFMAAASGIRDPQSEISGTVRIGTPDGFGLSFLAPRMREFSVLHPNLRIQLVPTPRSFSLSQREADIAVMIGRPQKGRLVARKLTDYTLGLYAAQSYLDQNGSPELLADILNHRLVGYVEDMIFAPTLNYNDEILKNWASTLEVSSAVGQFEAVRSGFGIGVLHDFMVRSSDKLVRLFPTPTLSRTYWTVWHESMGNTKNIRVVSDFLADLARDHKDRFFFVQ